MRNTIFSIIIMILTVFLIVTLIKSLFRLAGSIILIGIIAFAIKYMVDKRNQY